MSASPQPTQSTKRPLEDASSPSRTEQPDAKRPALDKVIKPHGEDAKELLLEHNGASSPLLKPESDAAPAPTADAADAADAPDASATKANGEKIEAKDAQGDTVVLDAPETKPIASTAGGIPSTSESNPAQSADETAWIHVRAVISSPEAATVIGKGGENVSKIRQMSSAKCTVSDYQKGAVERILTVSGVVDAVAKAFGLIIRTLNNEPLGEPSSAQSKTYPLRLLIPHLLIGSIIGKGGSRIKEIQEASGARLNASDSCLPLSTERSLVVMGVADAVHIATYYVTSTLLEQLNERFGGPAASSYATRSGGPVGAVPGGMQVIPYNPQPAGGNFGQRDNYNNRDNYPRRQDRPPMMPGNPYGPSYGAPHSANPQQPMPMGYPQAGGYAAAGGGGGVPLMPPHAGGPQQNAMGPAQGQLTQQIFIPNDMVGAIIGKGGSKINEIRQISGSVIKINEPQDNSNERLVTISGTEECNRMALYMLYSRLDVEKHRG